MAILLLLSGAYKESRVSLSAHSHFSKKIQFSILPNGLIYVNKLVNYELEGPLGIPHPS